MTVEELLKKQSDAERRLDELLEVRGDLTRWEIRYIESLNKQRSDAILFTPRQLDTVIKLHKDNCM